LVPASPALPGAEEEAVAIGSNSSNPPCTEVDSTTSCTESVALDPNSPYTIQDWIDDSVRLFKETIQQLDKDNLAMNVKIVESPHLKKLHLPRTFYLEMLIDPEHITMAKIAHLCILNDNYSIICADMDKKRYAITPLVMEGACWVLGNIYKAMNFYLDRLGEDEEEPNATDLIEHFCNWIVEEKGDKDLHWKLLGKLSEDWLGKIKKSERD
jgi:hypothetical protein